MFSLIFLLYCLARFLGLGFNGDGLTILVDAQAEIVKTEDFQTKQDIFPR
jgi:hypothetical protein